MLLNADHVLYNQLIMNIYSEWKPLFKAQPFLLFCFTLIGISSLSIFKSKWSEAEYISSLGGLDHFFV